MAAAADTTTPVPEEAEGYKAEDAPVAPGGEDDGEDGEDGEGGAPDMAGLEAMMGGMGGGEGGAGGMDMNALMAMLGKGGGKGGGGGMGDMMGGMGGMGGMGDMGGMMGGGGKGGGKGQQAPEEEVEKTDDALGFTWSQKGEEVHIRFKLDPPCTNKKEIEVKFKATSLKVAIRGETKIDGALGGKVEADDCTWCFSPEKDTLMVMLTKVEGKTESWRDLLA